MKLTYYGHSCFQVEIKGKKILFDPFITYNELAKDIDVNSIEADYILLDLGAGTTFNTLDYFDFSNKTKQKEK